MQTYYKRLSALTAALVLFAACASLSVKQRVHNAHMSVRTALVAVDEFERGMCQPTPGAINTCSATPRLLSDAQHQQVSGLLRDAFLADAKIGQAIIAWQPGAPVPSDLPSLQTLVAQLDKIAAVIAPSSQAAELIARIKALVDAVAQTAAAFGGVK